MSRVKVLILTIAVACTGFAVPQSAEAGPLLDWLRGACRRPANNGCNTCQIAAPRTQTVASPVNPYNLQPGQCQKTCNQTCSRVVVNYVPYTAYRTNWERVPVTQYRPVTNTDPCSGCTVTCMKPCTTYSWQMKRVPYTTYRACYKTENYTVPVTTITNDCNTGCNTGCCPTTPQTVFGNQVPVSGNQVMQAPATTNNNVQGSYYTYPNGGVIDNGTYNTPSGTITTDGGFSTPANTVPSLNGNPTSLQRPVMDRFAPQDSQTYWPRLNAPKQTRRGLFRNIRPISQPKKADCPSCQPTYNGYTASKTPVRQRWSYSPVRLASYTSVEKPRATAQKAQYHTDLRPVAKRTMTQPKPVRTAPKRDKNSGWATVK